jgi:hypothetical protein
MQPPSLISSLCEITESLELEPVLPRRRQFRHPPPVPLRELALLLRDDGDGAPHDAPLTSWRRLPQRDRPLLSHRWPPALRGSLPPEPAPPTLPTSGPPHRHEPQPGQPDWLQ